MLEYNKTLQSIIDYSFKYGLYFEIQFSKYNFTHTITIKKIKSGISNNRFSDIDTLFKVKLVDKHQKIIGDYKNNDDIVTSLSALFKRIKYYIKEYDVLPFRDSKKELCDMKIIYNSVKLILQSHKIKKYSIMIKHYSPINVSIINDDSYENLFFVDCLKESYDYIFDSITE